MGIFLYTIPKLDKWELLKGLLQYEIWNCIKALSHFVILKPLGLLYILMTLLRTYDCGTSCIGYLEDIGSHSYIVHTENHGFREAVFYFTLELDTHPWNPQIYWAKDYIFLITSKNIPQDASELSGIRFWVEVSFWVWVHGRKWRHPFWKTDGCVSDPD